MSTPITSITVMKPTTLAGLLIEKSLNNAELVNSLQKQYCTQTSYRVVLVNNGGEELVYLLTAERMVR